MPIRPPPSPHTHIFPLPCSPSHAPRPPHAAPPPPPLQGGGTPSARGGCQWAHPCRDHPPRRPARGGQRKGQGERGVREEGWGRGGALKSLQQSEWGGRRVIAPSLLGQCLARHDSFSCLGHALLCTRPPLPSVPPPSPHSVLSLLPPLPCRMATPLCTGRPANGHAPVVAALLADPRVEVNAKDNVRGGAGGGCAEWAGGTMGHLRCIHLRSDPRIARSTALRGPAGARPERPSASLWEEPAMGGERAAVPASLSSQLSTAFEWVPFPHPCLYSRSFQRAVLRPDRVACAILTLWVPPMRRPLCASTPSRTHAPTLLCPPPPIRAGWPHSSVHGAAARSVVHAPVRVVACAGRAAARGCQRQA